jgi:hypothetical protein
MQVKMVELSSGHCSGVSPISHIMQPPSYRSIELVLYNIHLIRALGSPVPAEFAPYQANTFYVLGQAITAKDDAIGSATPLV